MYEITVIETATSDGHLFMCHIPCNDDDIETVSGEIITAEDEAIAAGVVTAYTTITNFFPNRDAFLHYTPRLGLEVTP